MRKFLTRARSVGRTALDLFPFTPLGVLILGGAAFALFVYGVRHIDLILLIIGLVALALGALTMLVVSVTAAVMYTKLRKRGGEESLRLECGYAARTGFSVSSLWFVPFVKLSWSWVTPDATVTAVPLRRRLYEEITPQRRGLHEEIVRRIEVSDAFGLTRIAFKVREERTVRFAPSMGSLKQMHVVRSIAGGDNLSHPAGPPEGERVDMRHYSPGDPIKFVLWKVFARSRQLVIRTPERAISPVRQTVAYLVAGDRDEPAAGAARVAVESGALGSEWVLGADGNEVYAKTSPQALEVLAKSANTTTEQSGAGLGRFLSSATPGGIARAVVFVPAKPGPWLDRVVTAARTRTAPNQPASPVEFVICADGISNKLPPSRLAKILLQPERDERGAPIPRTELNAVIQALSAARARVLVVDRLAGRVYGEAHQRALEAA